MTRTNMPSNVTKLEPRTHTPEPTETDELDAEQEHMLLLAFPWAVHLTPGNRERFARELADHPSDISNKRLESMLTSWKANALAAKAQAERLYEAVRRIELSSQRQHG